MDDEAPIKRHLMTRLGKGLERAYKNTGAITLKQFCDSFNVGYAWMCTHIHSEFEPRWMRYLRAVKRASGMSWEDILGR